MELSLSTYRVQPILIKDWRAVRAITVFVFADIGRRIVKLPTGFAGERIDAFHILLVLLSVLHEQTLLIDDRRTVSRPDRSTPDLRWSGLTPRETASRTRAICYRGAGQKARAKVPPRLFSEEWVPLMHSVACRP